MAIRFANELLPEWAQLLDVAARLCPVSYEVRQWFSRFTAGSGIADSRTVVDFSTQLRSSIQKHRLALIQQLQRSHEDSQALKIVAAWIYALDTMILTAGDGTTSSWVIEGTEDVAIDDAGDGDISLRRV